MKHAAGGHLGWIVATVVGTLAFFAATAAQAFNFNAMGLWTERTSCPAGQMWDPDAAACKTTYRYWRVRAPSGSASTFSRRVIQLITFRWGGQWQTSAMTDFTTGTLGDLNVTISESSSYSASVTGWRAFATGSFWQSNSGTYSTVAPNNETTPNWLAVDFGANPRWISGYTVVADPGNLPVDRTRLEYSTDGNTWTTVPGSDTGDNANFTSPGLTKTW